MCGIIGGISFESGFFPDEQELRKGSDFLKYRGPDDGAEIFLDGAVAKVVLGHRRLSIIDLSETGRQPMSSVSGKSFIVFNGEIYNYQLLRRELEEKKFHFQSTSDTEVILNGYECWGIDATLKKIDGMFAFALFDLKENVMILARDPFGKKPLYFFNGGRRLYFSSDIRSFASVGSIPRDIDLHALGYFFAELSTPFAHTIWKGIRKVNPGAYLVFGSSGIVRYERYFQLTYTESCDLDRASIISTTENFLSQAVRKRLIGDVDVGALLSGGIDSSLVVAKMAEHKSGRLKTYSVGFKEESFNELDYARQVARKFNTDHTEIVLRPENLPDIYDLIAEFGEPFADASMVPTYWVSREVAKTEKAVLGGDGGDELFGGYESYHFASKYELLKGYYFLLPLARMLHRFSPTYRTNLLVKALLQARRPMYFLLDRNIGFDRCGLAKLLGSEMFYDSLDTEHRSIWTEFTTESASDVINLMSASLRTRLHNDYLVKIDRATMRASLEMRSPFLDKQLAEFAATLTSRQLFQGGPKGILKELALKYFPSEFVQRRKAGFSVPLGEWFKGRLAKDLKEIVLGGKQKLVPLNYEYAEEVINSHCSGKGDHSNKLWALFVFHIWANKQ